MSKIRSKNTKPEVLLRSILFRKGFRFRVHYLKLPGKPDIVLPKYKTVIFVHGCFWHYHEDCNEGRIPNTNTSFWETKLSKNVERDLRHQNEILNLGWQVIVVWECQLIKKNIESLIDELVNKIQSNLNS